MAEEGSLTPAKAASPRRRARRRADPTGGILKKIRATRDGRVRLKIIRAVSGIEAGWVNSVLLESLSDPNEAVRTFLVETLGSRPDLNPERIYKKMALPPWYQKSSCLKILGARKDPGCLRHIEALLNDPNVDVKRTAAEVLGEIGGREALALLARLVRDKNQFVRISAERAMLKASDLKFC
jgi:HEAT repeat protein